MLTAPVPEFKMGHSVQQLPGVLSSFLKSQAASVAFGVKPRQLLNDKFLSGCVVVTPLQLVTHQ